MLEQLTKHHYVLSCMTYQKIFFNQKLLPEAATINLLLEKMSFFIDADNISLFNPLIC
jgi:hypothetical protein